MQRVMAGEGLGDGGERFDQKLRNRGNREKVNEDEVNEVNEAKRGQ